VSLAAVAERVARAVDALADAPGMPSAPRPLRPDEGAPWTWRSPAAVAAGADPHEVAARLTGDPLLAGVAVAPGGWLVLTFAPAAMAAHLARLASGVDLPAASAPPPAPRPGADVERFEVARRAAGAPALPAGVAGRRILGNPVVVVQLAHARAVRRAGTDLARGGAAADVATTLDPDTRGLLTELLQAPGAFVAQPAHPERLAAALLAVATAYLRWEERAEAGPGTLLVSEAGRGVLHAGMARLGVHAPGRM